jgi:molybdenum cofactor cytidylyltransferase
VTNTEGAVAGIVLAAGLAERMGRAKQLLPFAGTTLLNAALANAAASRLDRVILVLGAYAEEVEASLEASRAEVVHNPHYRRGNMASLRVGIEAAGDAAAVMHLLGDMPHVGPPIIDRLLDVWESRHPWVAVSEYRDRVGHPFLYSRAATEEIARLEGRKAVWRFLAAAPHRAVEQVAFDLPFPVDVDTPQDYERAVTRSETPPLPQ